ncbi:MAG: DegV family protein [Anaerolineae bacterium]
MARTSILTDSTSGLNAEEAAALGIAIVPVRVTIDNRTYREGVDLSPAAYYELVSKNGTVRASEPPTARDFHEAFRRLGRESEEIVAVLASSRLSAIVSVARQAAQSYLGGPRVTIVDSRLTATPLAWLTLAAAEAAAAGVDGAEIVRLLRTMIPHMYISLFVENMEPLRQRGLAPRAPALPSSAANKPLLIIEDGELMILERSRSRGRAVDRLFEFVTEFHRLERVAILQGKPLPESLELATLLNEEIPNQPVETTIYPASIAANVGTDALGVAIYEGIG